MGEICLSVAPNLRCQSLTGLEAGILLLPPGLEVFFACVLLWIKRASADKKHVFLASEIYVYFLLAVLDILAHRVPSVASSLDSFRSLDIVIGAGSFIPLFLFTFSLYLLTSTELVPSLPIRFQTLARYTLIAFIPIILILNEVASFVGITYRSVGGQNGVGFTNGTVQVFLSSVTLVLLTVFQAMNFCIAFFRLVKALSHQRTIETVDREKKEMEAHLFRGLGWIVVGLKLGAIETVIGFVQDGFAIPLTRRLLRFLGHACLVIGIVKGVDTVEDFQLYSPSEAQRRRKSMLRAMIQNPRFSTFRHVGGHDFDAENAITPKRESIVKLGDPSWMRRDFRKSTAMDKVEEEERATPGLLYARKSSSLMFKLASRPSFRTSSRKSKGSSVRDSTSSFGSSKRTSWPAAQGAIGENDEDAYPQAEAEDVVATEFTPVPRPGLGHPRPVRERVTVFIRQDRLPILQLRRFSNLEFLDLMTDPFRDPHGRARSLPSNFDEAEPRPAGHVSASFSRLPMYTGALTEEPLPALRRPPSVHESIASRHTRSMSLNTHDRPTSAMSQRTMRPPSVATNNPRDSGVTFQARDSVASYNPRDTMTSYNPRDTMGMYNPRDTMASYNPRDTIGSYNPRDTMTSYNPRDSTVVASRPPSTMTFHAIGTPGTATTFDPPQSAVSPRYGNLSRRDRGVPSSTTASEVQAIASQFPGIPMRPAPATRPKSMLSHEVPRTEFIVEEDEPMPGDAAYVRRAPSAKRQPAPVVEEAEPSEPSTPKYEDKVEPERVQERVISEQEATLSLPTPLSPPHAVAQWPTKRARSLSGSGKRHRPPPLVLDPAPADAQPTPSDNSSVNEATVRSASLVQRQAMQGKLMRVKSVGSAPRRSVSSSRRTARPRDSIQVELGHIARERKVSIASLSGGPGRGRGLVREPRPSEEAVDVVRTSVFGEV
ncbi:hypothetical protein OH77DRAFT_1495220 [Trametes cingulata]|nr:hypothetical protein OH77DRAFT_1495220 [Trametes cingulata]